MPSYMLFTDSEDHLEVGVWDLDSLALDSLLKVNGCLYWCHYGGIRKLPLPALRNAVSEWEDWQRAGTVMRTGWHERPALAGKIRWDQTVFTPNQTAALRLPPLYPRTPLSPPCPATPTY